MDRGIDYSLGQSNFNPETGIHFGVIPMDSLAHWAWDSFEPEYGEPTCPKCGNPAVGADSEIPTSVLEEKGHMELDDEGMPDFDGDRHDLGYEISSHSCGDYACDYCGYLFDGDEAFPEECLGHTLDDGEYKASVDSYNDAFLLDSPYYTTSQFCSPCAPGAGYLLNFVVDGVKTYCFGPEWFDKEQPCPYPIWKCGTDELIYSPPEEDAPELDDMPI